LLTGPACGVDLRRPDRRTDIFDCGCAYFAKIPGEETPSGVLIACCHADYITGQLIPLPGSNRAITVRYWEQAITARSLPGSHQDETARL